MILSFLSNILEIDKKILLAINSYHTSSLDILMIAISNKFYWIPFYVLLLFLIYRKYKENTLIILIFLILLIVFTDQISVLLFKNTFARLRPCHEPSLKNILHLVNGNCGGQYGFISSHAANTAGLATGIILLLRSKYLWLIPLVLLFALLNAFSRVYLGVHYPTDVVAGMFLGLTVCLLLYFFLIFILKKLKKYQLIRLIKSNI